MDLSIYLRFLNGNPITSLTSAVYPSFFRRYFWHSTAILSKQIIDKNNSSFLKDCGGGWSEKKLESQIKAIVEAVERWAYFYYLNNYPQKAFLDIDRTTTGFAAVPKYFENKILFINSYCESVERFVLNYIWDFGLKLEENKINNNKIIRLFSIFKGKLYNFSKAIETEKDFKEINSINFYLSAFRLENGGVIIGTSCGIDEKSIYRSFFELFINILTFKRMKKLQIKGYEELNNIIEKRLFYFGSNNKSFKSLIEQIGEKKCSKIIIPKINFAGILKGPWEPEIKVGRIVLKNSKEFTTGSVDKLVI
ncbi:MAG: hypothetical protein KA059_02820 [Elusimicrobiales bacterium]|nr:hypothetical protein [Elusimicrobiales bacterium]